MRDWSAFVHEGHLDALEDHLEEPGLYRQPRAAAAVRGDARQRPHLVDRGQPLPARQARAAVGPALLVRGRRAHPRRLPQELQSRPAARQQAARSPAGLRGRRHRRSTSPRSRRRCWSSRSRTTTSRHGKRSIAARAALGADFVLGGSGHNAGVINPPAANKHGYWTNDEQPEDADEWLASATKRTRAAGGRAGPSG